jgi:hypothetical protein
MTHTSHRHDSSPALIVGPVDLVSLHISKVASRGMKVLTVALQCDMTD